jgi:phosphatidylserine/phosphatidylglycerophosphate/cardiolipin synthase-like enzyme
MVATRGKIAAYFLLLLIISPVYAADVTPFSSPENSLNAMALFLKDAQSVKIAVYTFSSRVLAETLPANTEIIVDKSPVGGVSDEQKDVLCYLQNKGAEIYMYDGPHRYMHAKYAVYGDNVLVTTENFGYAGFNAEKNPKNSNRGWGLIIKDNKTVQEFTKIFEEDLKESVKFVCDEKVNGKSQQQTLQLTDTLKTYQNQLAQAIFAPDAVEDIVKFLNSSQKRIYVEQFYIYKTWGKKENPFLGTIINKARQGVEVKILLDNTYYNLDNDYDNDDVVSYINEIAQAEKLDMQARLTQTPYLITHAKGVIVDNSVFVSSINWNENSPRNNREAGVIISGTAAAYFEEKFLSDWDNKDTITTGHAAQTQNNIIIAVVTIILVIVAYVVWKKVK